MPRVKKCAAHIIHTTHTKCEHTHTHTRTHSTHGKTVGSRREVKKQKRLKVLGSLTAVELRVAR